IAVCNSFVLGAEADRKEAVVMADLDGEDFRFAMSDPVQWCEVREIRTLRRVQGESCVQRDVEIAKSFESNGCIWATGTTRRLPDVFCGVCRGTGVKIENGCAGEPEVIEAEMLQIFLSVCFCLARRLYRFLGG